MKKLVLAALSAVVMSMNVVYAEDSAKVAGIWMLLEENGQPQAHFEKTYFSDGTFRVDEFHEVEYNPQPGDGVFVNTTNGKVRVLEGTLVQRGTWEMPDGSTIIEKCEKGDKGNVKITFALYGDWMVQTFAYDKAPDKPYVQSYQIVGQVPTEEAIALEGHIDGYGTFSRADKVVFILDNKHYNYEEFLKVVPDTSLVENIHFIGDGAAPNLMTDEERAAGKDRVMIVTLKK